MPSPVEIDSYLELHARVELDHWWFVSRRRILRPIISRLMQKHPSDLIIDVGCGTGGTVQSVAHEFRCLGIDQSHRAIDLARRNYPHCEFIQGDFSKQLRKFAASTELFLLMDVLEHIEDDKQFLARLVDMARPKSLILITVPADDALWGVQDESVGHFRRYDEESLQSVWRDMDVRPSLLTYFNYRLYPLMWISRQLSRRTGMTFGQKETDIDLPPSALNALLTYIFSGEAPRILDQLDQTPSNGARYGSSLLAVLKKN